MNKHVFKRKPNKNRAGLSSTSHFIKSNNVEAENREVINKICVVNGSALLPYRPIRNSLLRTTFTINFSEMNKKQKKKSIVNPIRIRNARSTILMYFVIVVVGSTVYCEMKTGHYFAGHNKSKHTVVAHTILMSARSKRLFVLSASKWTRTITNTRNSTQQYYRSGWGTNIRRTHTHPRGVRTQYRLDFVPMHCDTSIPQLLVALYGHWSPCRNGIYKNTQYSMCSQKKS